MTPSEWDEGFRAGLASVSVSRYEREIEGWREIAQRERARRERAEALIEQINEVYRGPYRPLGE